MQGDTRKQGRVAHPASTLEWGGQDPDVLILQLSHGSSRADEDHAYMEAHRLLGHFAQRYLYADELYDVFELSAAVDYRRTSDSARK